jgi:hypothetical protein
MSHELFNLDTGFCVSSGDDQSPLVLNHFSCLSLPTEHVCPRVIKKIALLMLASLVFMRCACNCAVTAIITTTTMSIARGPRGLCCGVG